MEFDREEMMRRWMLLRYGEMPRCDAAVKRVDGVDLTLLAEVEMEAWFDALVRRGDPREVAEADVSEVVKVVRVEDGVHRVELPPCVVRLTRVEWTSGARGLMVGSGEAPALLARQRNVLTRMSAGMPVVAEGGGGRFYMIYGGDERPDCIMGLRDSSDGVYRLQNQAFNTIKYKEENE